MLFCLYKCVYLINEHSIYFYIYLKTIKTIFLPRIHMSLNDKKRLAREKAEQYNSNGRPLRQYHMLTNEEIKQGKETHWEELEIIGMLC